MAEMVKKQKQSQQEVQNAFLRSGIMEHNTRRRSFDGIIRHVEQQDANPTHAARQVALLPETGLS
eukprot:742576-Rhodomonas_salina.1